MPKEKILNGRILIGEDLDLVEGNLIIEGEKIVGIEEETAGSDIIIPAFINAHTHIGDSFAKDIPFKDLIEIVTPPNGIKHRLLMETPEDEILDSMRIGIRDMVRCGTVLFADFREGGPNGVELLRYALKDAEPIEAKIFGRPEKSGDIGEVLKGADGIGMSSTNDHDWDFLVESLEETHKAGKKFAIHAGERDETDIEGAIELGADILVHLTHADERYLKRIKDLDIGVVVCPRSNFVTGVGRPDLKKMLDLGLNVAIGTDNFMLNSPNIFSELEFISKIFCKDNDKEVLKMACKNPSKIFGLDFGEISEGKSANLIVLDGESSNLHGCRDVIKSVIRRARPDDIKWVLYGGKFSYSHKNPPN